MAEVAVNWLGLYSFLEANPTGTAEEMVGLLYERSFPYHDSQIANFTELAANGWHYTDPGENLIAIQVLDHSDTSAVVRFATSRGEQVLVDDSGAEVKRYLGWDPVYFDLTFNRADPESQWLATDNNGPSQTLTADILDAMQPVAWTLRGD